MEVLTIMNLKDTITHLDPAQKQIIDVTSIGVAVGSLADMLPAIAAVLTIVWTIIRIYETATVQRWLGKSKSTANVEQE